MAMQKVEKMEVREEVQHSAETVWRACTHNMQTMVPTVMAGYCDSIKYEKGPPFTPGSVFVANCHRDMPHYDYVKLRWDEVNHQRYRLKCTVVEGGLLNKHFSHLAYIFSLTPASTPSSCIINFSVEYEDLGQHTFHDFIKKELQTFCTKLNAYLKTVKDV